MVSLIVMLSAGAALAACGGGSSSGGSSSGGSATGDDAHTLSVIAGSELRDLEPYFDQIHRETGVTLAPTYSGTLSGIDRVEAGEQFDLAWFANDKYLLLSDKQHRVKAQERIMLSPVVVGVKRSKANALGWVDRPVTWKDIAARAGDGSFLYAMTNPASSNSGFSAVIGVTAALAGTADAIRASDVDNAKLATFYRGQRLTSGSSGWLVDAYVHDQDRLDGIINYESSLIVLNASGNLKEPLVLIYPKEGVVTADYPLVLLSEQKRDLYTKVVNYLKGDAFQRIIMEKTFRRPTNPSVALAPEFTKKLLVELPFPNNVATVDAILLRYLNHNRVPSHSFYVLDTSGSMDGPRIEGVRAALHTLSGADPSLAGRFARFENRERITLISFSDTVTTPVDLEMHSANDTVTLEAVKTYADALQAGGSTAIFSALEAALDDAARARPGDGGRYDSIVLMTDGENNRGDDFARFQRRYEALAPANRVKIFPILFGEGNADQLRHIADLSGGRMFDSTKESLSTVFKEIRGYQ
jgi:Ca-activated chloride channel family protein